VANERREVVVTDVKIPFWSMVVLMVKWAIAAIPAVIILIAIFALLYCAPFRGVPHLRARHQAIDFQRNRARLGEPKRLQSQDHSSFAGTFVRRDLLGLPHPA